MAGGALNKAFPCLGPGNISQGRSAQLRGCKSSEQRKKKTGCFRVFVGDEIKTTQLYEDYFMNHDKKDPMKRGSSVGFNGEPTEAMPS